MHNAMHKALAKRVAICQSSTQCARALMHLILIEASSRDFGLGRHTIPFDE